MDPRHVHHELAHSWFAGSAPGAWATCPITKNAVLRILGHPRYPNSPGPPAVVAPLLQGLLAHPRHRFWPDGLSLLTGTVVLHERLLDSAQLTDACLLGLAVHHAGTLVTLIVACRGMGCEVGLKRWWCSRRVRSESGQLSCQGLSSCSTLEAARVLHQRRPGDRIAHRRGRSLTNTAGSQRIRAWGGSAHRHQRDPRTALEAAGPEALALGAGSFKGR